MADPRRTERLRRRVERIQRLDTRIVEAMALAATFDDEGEPPTHVGDRKLTKLERQVAKDARLAKRFAPVYLELAANRYVVARKAEALKPATVTLNAQAVQFVMGSPGETDTYRVIDITESQGSGDSPRLVGQGEADGK